MTPLLVAIALVVTAGAVAAVSAREPRLAALGVVVALAGAAYVADPLPGTTALATRIVGAVLGGYLLWIGLRGAPARTAGWRIGWPGAAAVAVAAFVTGWLAADALGAALAASSGEGPSAGAVAAQLVSGSLVARAAVAAAFALLALAAGPVLIARDVLRLGLGLLLAVAAAELLRGALVERVDPVVELALGLLYAFGGAGVAAASARSLRIHGDLELRDHAARETAVRARVVDDAHPARPAR